MRTPRVWPVRSGRKDASLASGTGPGYPELTVTCPGMATVITPIHMHMTLHGAVRAGWPLTRTSGWPGVHGAVVTGMHGAGVGTPRPAAVRAITAAVARGRH